MSEIDRRLLTPLGTRAKVGLILAAAIAPLAIPLIAMADEDWAVGSGNWSLKTNWTPANVPVFNDTVRINDNDSVVRTVTLDISTALISSLTLDNTGTGNNILSIGSFQLTSNYETIGDVGHGSVNQSGGTNSVSAVLTLGNNSGAIGNYNLSGGTLTVGGCDLGYSGAGSINQTGGTATFNAALRIGHNGSGNYAISNASLLITKGEVRIGDLGDGTYVQNGGTHTASGTVTVGLSGQGTATVSGGTWTIGGQLIIGGSGNGSFNHSAGSVSANNSGPDSLDIGRFSGSSGLYKLSATGILQVAGSEQIGIAGLGRLDQSGGSHAVAGSVTVGSSTGGTGVATLSGGTWTVGGALYVGNNGSGIFSQTAGSLSVNGVDSSFLTLALGAGASGVGAYTLGGTGSLTVNGNESIGYLKDGTFTQSGGTHKVLQFLTVGLATTASGTAALSGGSWNVTASAFIGHGGVGVFNQSGGTFTAGDVFSVAELADSSGTATVSAGTFNAATLYIGNGGNGQFTHSGGTMTVGGLLTVGNAATGKGLLTVSNTAHLVDNGAVIAADGQGDLTQSGGTHTSIALKIGAGIGSMGTYSLSGGSLTDDLVYVGLNGTGVFNQSGGTHTIRLGGLHLGSQSTGSGSYFISGNSTLQVNGTESIGGPGIGYVVQNGGLHNVTGSLQIARGSSYNLLAGQLTSPVLVSGDGASFAQIGGTFLTNEYFQIDGNGTYQLESGSSTTPNLTIGYGSAGAAILNAGSLSATTIDVYKNGSLSFLGSAITNSFIYNAGLIVVDADTQLGALNLDLGAQTTVSATLTLSAPLSNMLGQSIGGTGRVVLSAGGGYQGWGVVVPSVTANSNIKATGGTLLLTGPNFSNSATMTSTVGSNIIVHATSVTNTGNIVVNAASSVSFSAPLTITTGHNATLSGGALGAQNLTIAAGGLLSGFGQISSPVVNSGNVTLSGLTQLIGNLTNQSTGNVTVRNNQLMITGSTINNGTIRAQAGGSIVFDGGITGNPIAGAAPLGAASLGASAALLTPFIRQSSLTLGGTAGDPNSYPVASIRPSAEGGETSLLGSLTFQADGGGTLLGKMDLADNALIVNYTGPSPLTEIKKAIRSAYNTPSPAHWTGPGLTSSIAAKTPGMALGYAEASDALGLTGAQAADFRGQAADATSVLVRYTLSGDSDLDGSVGFADLVHVAQNYGVSNGTATWFKGDFNYDGNVDFADLVAVAQHYGASLASSSIPGAAPNLEGDLAAAFNSVPEPGNISVLGFGCIALTRRRRR